MIIVLNKVECMKKQITAFMALIGATALSLSACGNVENGTASDSAAADNTIVASFYPLAYLAEQISGETAEVINLTPSGEAHDTELSAADIDTMANADAVIYLSGFQPAIDEAVETTKPAQLLDVADSVALVASSEHESELSHEHEHDHEAEHDHEHEHDHAGEHDHDHGAFDPHFWLDPQRMRGAIAPTVELLTRVFPQHADTYKANGQRLDEKLVKLDENYDKKLTSCSTPTVVVAHEAYGYLAERFGFTQIGVSGIDPEQETSAQRLEQVAKVAKEAQVKVLFSESALSAKDTKTLAETLGIKTEVLDPLEIQADPEQDYIAVMQSNLEKLTSAMSCPQ